MRQTMSQKRGSKYFPINLPSVLVTSMPIHGFTPKSPPPASQFIMRFAIVEWQSQMIGRTNNEGGEARVRRSGSILAQEMFLISWHEFLSNYWPI